MRALVIPRHKANHVSCEPPAVSPAGCIRLEWLHVRAREQGRGARALQLSGRIRFSVFIVLHGWKWPGRPTANSNHWRWLGLSA